MEVVEEGDEYWRFLRRLLERARVRLPGCAAFRELGWFVKAGVCAAWITADVIMSVNGSLFFPRKVVGIKCQISRGAYASVHRDRIMVL